MHIFMNTFGKGSIIHSFLFSFMATMANGAVRISIDHSSSDLYMCFHKKVMQTYTLKQTA